MKTIRWFLVLAVLALGLSVSAAAVSAAGSDPVGAPFADNTTHTIGANTTTWYRFHYTGDHSQITIKLVDAKDQGLAFQVYAPSQMEEWWKNDGIGAGSVKDHDLLWTGNAHEDGFWYVKVENRNLAPMPFQLIVTGEKVSFGTPTFSTSEAALPQFASSLDNADPNKAVIVDSNWRSIPAKTTLWYRFAYSGTHDQAILKVLDGGKNQLRVHVHTPEQMKTWWNVNPVGQATPHGDDLMWNGSAEESGWWYVEVMNDNTSAVNFQLLLEILQSNIS
jgi:hypothetical protein